MIVKNTIPVNPFVDCDSDSQKMNSVIENGFDWSDYTVFVIMLSASVLIGIYFGCFGSKQRSPIDYLLGGRSMNAVPVGLSLVASYVSGSSLIGVPSEVYTESPTYWVHIYGIIIGSIIAYYFYIPIFIELNVSTAYEYLEYRFDKRVRNFASCSFSIAYLIFLPIVVYVPSLTLSLGINLYVLSIGVTSVCIFYTLIGGLKAVIWTDFIQITVTVVACIAIIIVGTIDGGGFIDIMKINYDDGKLNIFDMDLNPFQRSSFGIMLLGGIISGIGFQGVSPGNVQRYLSLKSSKDIPIVLLVSCIGLLLVYSLCVYGGLLVYAAYYGCDPIQCKLVSRTDQIFPYYIIDKIGFVPTLPGLFIAGVFGAALSTLSTGFNTITGIIYEDYIKTRVDEKNVHIYMKLITFLIGIFSMSMVFIVEKMGKILSVAYIITSITATPVFTVFTLGIMFPLSNTKGAIASMVSSMLFLAWVAIGSTVNKVNFISSGIYPEVNDTCSCYTNTTISTEPDDIFLLYKLSYMLYSLFGLIIGTVCGIATSYFTGWNDLTKLDPTLISPPLRRFLPKQPENPLMLEKLMDVM